MGHANRFATTEQALFFWYMSHVDVNNVNVKNGSCYHLLWVLEFSIIWCEISYAMFIRNVYLLKTLKSIVKIKYPCSSRSFSRKVNNDSRTGHYKRVNSHKPLEGKSYLDISILVMSIWFGCWHSKLLWRGLHPRYSYRTSSTFFIVLSLHIFVILLCSS